MPLAPPNDRGGHDGQSTKLIAEAWDAGGLYQVGCFPGHKGIWAEWNGKFRDTVRQFIKGTDGFAGEFAERLCGSPQLYATSGRAPRHSVNFVTAHDGFTLMDAVSYNKKHNEANGENNRDGEEHNLSWNCGLENRVRIRGEKGGRRAPLPLALRLRLRRMPRLPHQTRRGAESWSPVRAGRGADPRPGGRGAPRAADPQPDVRARARPGARRERATLNQ